MPIKIFFGLLFFIQLTFSSAVLANIDDPQQVTTPAADVATSDLSPTVTLNVDNYGVSEGLSQSIVTSVAEDEEGYIWVGTINGLNRFDGKSFKQFYVNDGSGLGSSFIKALYFDQGKKKLYVGTDKGLQIYNSERGIFTKSTIKTAITSINGYNDYIKVISEDDVITIKNQEEHREKLLHNDVKTAAIANNKLYILDYSGNLYSEGKLYSTNVEHVYSNNNKLYYLKNNSIYNENEEIIHSNKKIFSFIVDNESIIFFQKKSILKYNLENKKTQIEHIKEINFFTKNFIKKIKGGIFTSNYNNGFSIIWNDRNILKNIPLNHSSIWSIRSNKEYIAIALEGETVAIYNHELTSLCFSFKSKKFGAKTIGLSEDKIYVGSLSGLDIYQLPQKADNQSSHPPLNTTLNISTSAIRVFDEKVYIGTTEGDLIVLDSRTNEILETYSTNKKSPIFDIYKNSDKNIFIASQSGLYTISTDLNLKKIYDSDFVFSISEYQDELYFGTSNKILKIDKHGAISELYKSGQPIFSMTSSNDLLLASSVRDVIALYNNEFFSIKKTFGAQEEYNSQSAININNRFILGGMDGLSILQKKAFLEKITSPIKTNAKIVSYSLFNIPVPQSEAVDFLSKIAPLSLNYTDYPFTLFFSSTYTSQTKVNYVYKMQGLSDSWISSNGIDNATYTNLSPGNYVFQLYAIDPLTGKKGDIESYAIEIRPPFWMTTEAKVIYALVALSFLFIVSRAFLRRRAVQRQIAQSEERLKLSLWGSGDEMWDWDIESGKIYRSNIWGALEFPQDGHRAGISQKESNIHPQDLNRVKNALDSHFNGETEHFEATYRVRSNSGDWLWILDRAKVVERDNKDKPLRMTGTIKNINSFKTTEEQLKLFERAIENISEGVFILDTRFHFVEVNDATCDITKCVKEQLIATPLHFSKYSDEYNRQIMILLQQQGRWMTEIEAVKGDGSEFLMELSIDAIYDELGELTHFVGVFSDISLRKKQEAELRRLTNTDLLTSLPNRSSLLVTLENLVKKDTHHTLMMMDLDNFKKINDSLGHQIGDQLLKFVAQRLKNIIPKHTNLYRLGGDEFALLIDKSSDIAASAIIANEVIEAFKESFSLSGEIIVVGVSIGIVLYPEDEQNEQALLRKADIAMYHAKSAGGNRYQFYSESLNRNALRQLEVESLIREALRDDLLDVYFQPKIHVATGKLAGMEALVRLNHPIHGLISPIEFIPLAEETGLIVEIGDVVLRKACFAAQGWREQGLFDGRVAVNLSSRQFALPDLQTRIESILRLTKLPASNLELEITEGTVISQPEKAIKVMHQLANMGISLALDDFGTGYSSLSYLKRFPIHTLKIDKAFVDDIDKSDRDLKMVDSIITIAHNMGLRVVGEGVEHSEQLSILKALKCEEIQGFIYSKAISAKEFTNYLQTKADTTFASEKLNNN
ncbi:EAL domain-containing protein [Shewanella sp. C32]|uniref:EAL domain-containing protein n=1 Tax=Shewanella electrica TaxID=515560 RepID=A0ABT2FNW7_9GAMM|nr:EAL domain-containing protein [Shewanella electrica]MCH1923672.1 EAL domain-containing protein [Shewanella electrica]MCS4556891.1 EAL domain-containing protein [Shewanella electrica]